MLRGQQAVAKFLLFALASGFPLAAQSLSFSADNDLVFGSDDKYTGGLQIGWMGDEYADTSEGSFDHRFVSAMSDLAETLLPIDVAAKRRNGTISLQEIIITPEDTQRSKPVYDDIPYAGILSVSASLFLWDETLFHELQLSVGAVGPVSGAEALQKAIHRAVRNREPRGWDNQLGNRLLLQAGYLAGVRQYAHRFARGRSIEWFNSVQAGVGNAFVGAGAGSVLRYGANLPKNFVTVNGLFNRSQSRQLNFDSRSSEWGWGVSAGLFINTFAYFYLYEASKDLGYSYERPNVVATSMIAFELYWETVQLSMELYTSSAADSLSRANNFGRLNMIWHVP